MGRFSNMSNDQLRQVKRDAAAERSTYSDTSDKDAQDHRDHKQAGRDYSDAASELSRRGKR
jgi:hypothetical protein